MKRIASLLLTAALVLGLFAGLTFASAVDMPATVSPENAYVAVYSTETPDTKYYFETITNPLINWACRELPGDSVIELQKDLFMTTATKSSNCLNIPYTLSSWYDSAVLGSSHRGEKELILDLGGKTLTYSGSENLFFFQRYGMTVRNGTIDYTCVGYSRNPFCFGLSTGQTGINDGSGRWNPILNLENVHVYNNTADGGCVANNFIYGTTINVKDSVLWSKASNVFHVDKTNQTKLESGVTPYGKNANVAINVEGSVLVSGNQYPIDFSSRFDLTKDVLTVSVKDSTMVTNTSMGLVMPPELNGVYNTNEQTATENAAWSLFLRNGVTATGKAHVYGTGGSSSEKLAFTDVQESDWFFPYVRDLCGAGIISGMTETTYAPNGNLTYGQALKLVALAVGEQEQAAVDSHWASGYLNLAMDRGWLYSEVGLNDNITRQQFCALAAAAAGITQQPASNPFKDTADTSVLALYQAGIINGMSADTFQPDGLLTRAQIAKIIFGIISL